MTTSEPTTGEIVATLRRGCLIVQRQAADRLESQERDNETMCGNNFDATSVTNVLAYLDTVMGLIHCADGIKDLIVSMQGTSEELTARAEQAEKQRDEAWDALDKRCEECFYSYDPKDETCIECAIGVWRGLPQDGEGLK